MSDERSSWDRRVPGDRGLRLQFIHACVCACVHVALSLNLSRPLFCFVLFCFHPLPSPSPLTSHSRRAASCDTYCNVWSRSADLLRPRNLRRAAMFAVVDSRCCARCPPGLELGARSRFEGEALRPRESDAFRSRSCFARTAWCNHNSNAISPFAPPPSLTLTNGKKKGGGVAKNASQSQHAKTARLCHTRNRHNTIKQHTTHTHTIKHN